jgi:hypothetical protein
MKYNRTLVNGVGIGIILAIIPAILLIFIMNSRYQTITITLTLIIITLFLLIGTPIINSYYPIYAPSLFGFCIIFLLLFFSGVFSKMLR